MLIKKKCLWCKRIFDCDEMDYQFCDRCIYLLEELEYALYKKGVTQKKLNIVAFLEDFLLDLERK